MNVRPCKGCGRLFNYIAGPHLCPVCREKLEDKFQEVKAYIEEHKGVSMQEVSEVCEVEMPQIKQWIREERLEITSDSAIRLSCEGCGAQITSGRFCDQCKYNITAGFKNIVAEHKKANEANKPQKTGSAKMRFMQD